MTDTSDQVAAEVRQLEILDNIMDEIRAELVRKLDKHPRLNSPHEAFAVMQGKQEDLWGFVRSGMGQTSYALEEAVKIGAAAARYLFDMTPRVEPQTEQTVQNTVITGVSQGGA